MPGVATHPPGSFLTWLLTRLAEGEKLTETKALNRTLVRDSVRERPDWFETELFGEPNREFDVAPLEMAHHMLLELKQVRRYKGQLMLTPAGRKLLGDLLRDSTDESAAAMSARLLYELLIWMQAGTVGELLAVTVCKVGASGNELSISEHIDLALDVARAHGATIPPRGPEYQEIIEPIYEVIYLMQALDLCTFRSPGGKRAKELLVFSDAGRAVIRAAGVTGRAELLDRR